MLTTLLLNVPLINTIYASAGLFLLAGTTVLFYDYWWGKQAIYIQLIKPYIWFLIPIVTFGGVATTLLYSEVFGFIPCSLCWLQRIALYPIALMSIAAIKMKDHVFFPVYGLVLASAGFLVAVYHYIYQHIPTETLQASFVPCLADGSADCADKVMDVFGFVTFPFLSAVLFLFLIVLFLHLRRSN
jgi:disulfide bond formation protein DsbB